MANASNPNLIDIASKGGNYLLNIGLTAEGEIPAASLDSLAGIGEWMKTHGESIHGTTASLFPKVSWDGRSTTRRSAEGGTHLYLHLFKRPDGGKFSVTGLVDRPVDATLLAQPGKLAVSGKPGAWEIQLPEGGIFDPIASVVVLLFPALPVVE